MDNNKRTGKSKPEEVIVYPGTRPVKISDEAKGGNPNPDDAFTGGGKVKSATRQNAPYEAEDRDRMTLDDDELSTDVTSLSNKEGMAKSAQRGEADVLTTTQQPMESRVKPNAEKK